MSHCSTCNSRLWRTEGCRVCYLTALSSSAVMAAVERRPPRVLLPEGVNMWLPHQDSDHLYAMLDLEQGYDVCCCGQTMEGHEFWDNHSPVSMSDNHIRLRRKEIEQVFCCLPQKTGVQ